MAEAKKQAKSTKPKAGSAKTKKAAKEAEVVVESAPTQAETEAKVEVEDPEKVTAKAGKRSTKAVREAEEKQAKEARKANAGDAKKKTKPEAKPPRPRLERAGKKYQQAAKLVDKAKTYSLVEALGLATKTTTTKFDSTVELHVNLNVDPKQADQNVRATTVLPAGSGKTVRVAVVAEGPDVDKAKKAGAEIAGSDDLLSQLDKEQIGFDILISTPAMMSRLAKYARLLGPKGLMPNPKSGTVTADVVKAVTEAKAGRIEFRVDGNGIVHCAIGKVSFGADMLTQNAEAVLSSIRSARPASTKGIYIKSGYVSTTMGPAIKIEI